MEKILPTATWTEQEWIAAVEIADDVEFVVDGEGVIQKHLSPGRRSRIVTLDVRFWPIRENWYD